MKFKFTFTRSSSAQRGPELRGRIGANRTNRTNISATASIQLQLHLRLPLPPQRSLVCCNIRPFHSLCPPVHLPPPVVTPNPPTRSTSVSAASGKSLSILHPRLCPHNPRSYANTTPALTFSTPRRTAKPTLLNSPAAPVTSARTRHPTASTRTN